MNKRFWDWVENENQSILRLDGYIAQESWFDDDITPKLFENELNKNTGDIVVWINSPGGDVFAGSQIYTMLKEYGGNVNVRIDGIAASAASVIAMAGDMVEMSPTALMMIHNPATLIFGKASDLKLGIDMLNEVKESIINAYELKTRISRLKISNMMDAETWFNAKKAVELGFADNILYENSKLENENYDETFIQNAFIYDKQTVVASLVDKLQIKKHNNRKQVADTEYKQLLKRLELIK